MEYKLLYEIKKLEKQIARVFLCDEDHHFLCENIPLTPTQMQIIDYILSHPALDIYQKDLEAVLNLRRATVSGVLQTMEKNHLIERIVDANDSRVKKIILNPNALQLFDKHLQKIKEIENMVIKDLSHEEITAFLNVLKKMQTNLQFITNKERK